MFNTPKVEHPSNQPNFCTVEVLGIKYAFSYSTCIAFEVGDGWIVRRNEWGVATGRHINALDEGDRSSRLGETHFQQALSDAESEAIEEWLERRQS